MLTVVYNNRNPPMRYKDGKTVLARKADIRNNNILPTTDIASADMLFI